MAGNATVGEAEGPPFKMLDDHALALLAEPARFAVFAALGPDAATAEEVAADAGVPVEAAWERLTELVLAGLAEIVRPEEARPAPGVARFRARHENVKDHDGSEASRLVFRLAVLRAAEDVARHARKALRARPAEARVGLALVSVRESPEAFEEALAILADAERRLKALAKRHPPAPGAPRVRLALLAASQ